MLALLLIAQLAVADTACTVPVPQGSGEWKQVTDGDATFCVPASWRVRGTRASYSGGSIRWQHAPPPAARSSSGGPTTLTGGARSQGASNVRTESFPEMIGGVQANLAWQVGVGRLTSSVIFRQPLFSIAGEAAGEEQIQTQLAVYRTVRFAQ